MSDAPTETEEKAASWKLSAVISVVILLIAGGLAAVTFMTEPTAQKSGATKKTAMLVDVVEAERGNFRPHIVAQGTVEPAQDVQLRPQVGGRITALAPGFTPGGFVKKGELLLRIESADFEHALAQRKSELRQASSELAIEQGHQSAAQAEYDYLGEDLTPENEALVLRQPQLEAAQGRVEAARAAVVQAELDLRRTTVEAPFDAHILRRDVNVGSQISPNDTLARLVGMQEYWVGVELPLPKLRLVSVAGEGKEGSQVQVRNRRAWPEGTYRRGHLFRLVGTLDRDTRMARVLASIPDPLARQPDPDEADPDETDLDEPALERPPLMIGEFVELTILGDELEGVVRLDRDYVRDKDTVWVMEDGKLQVREVDIVVRDSKYAYISSGIDDGARVVTTHISTVVEGAPLRLEASEEGAPSE